MPLSNATQDMLAACNAGEVEVSWGPEVMARTPHLVPELKSRNRVVSAVCRHLQCPSSLHGSQQMPMGPLGEGSLQVQVLMSCAGVEWGADGDRNSAGTKPRCVNAGMHRRGWHRFVDWRLGARERAPVQQAEGAEGTLQNHLPCRSQRDGTCGLTFTSPSQDSLRLPRCRTSTQRT